MLFVAAADIAFVHGSIFHGPGVGNREVFLIALILLLNIIFLGGLLHRQRAGRGGIGFEGLAIILTYLAGPVVLALGSRRAACAAPCRTPA